MWNSRFRSALQNKFQALSRRDRIALGVCAAVVFLFLLYQFAFQPLSEKREQLEAAIQEREQELAELTAIVRNYQQLTAQSSRNGNADQNFNLFASLEKMATSSGLMEHVDSMRPGSMDLDSRTREDWVEVQLSRAPLKEITHFLYLIRTANQDVYVKRFSARKDGDLLDAVVQPAVARVKE
ncbi:MAG: type II secretion system protein GspM [Desulfobacteraceae bacterium]|jgi:type II secretory pathway component PulM